MLQELKSKTLNKSITDFLQEKGAVSVGFATKETLRDSPPSADITYLMKNGLSAVTFVLPMKKEYIRPFLAKEDRFAHERDDVESNVRARELSDAVAEMIRGEGHEAIGTATNFRYRTEVENWRSFLPPEISHRYLAVASGAGSFGWSGNVGVKGYGTPVVFGTTITDAKLDPTYPIPPEDSFCSNCRACVKACPLEMFSESDTMSITLGGKEYTYSARINLARCFMCCGGVTGMHKSKKWSSWSPGRFEVPEDNDGLAKTFMRAGAAAANRPKMEGGVPISVFVKSIDSSIVVEDTNTNTATLTCGNCSLVCTGDKKENLENLKILRNSGCIIQYPDGSTKALPPDEAEKEFGKMDPKHRALYS